MGRTRLDVLVDLKGLDGAHGQNRDTWSLLVPSLWTRYSLDLNKSRATRLKDGTTRWLQLRSAVSTKLTKREKQQKNNILGGKTGWANGYPNIGGIVPTQAVGPASCSKRVTYLSAKQKCVS